MDPGSLDSWKSSRQAVHPAPPGSRLKGSLSRQAARLAAAGLLLTVGACGFQLRAVPQLPTEMARTYIAAEDRHSLFFRKLHRELQASGAEVVDNAAGATAIFTVLSDVTDQRVLSVSARNVPREYEVFYSVNYEVTAGGETLLAPQQQTATRDYNYDETQVLGKAREEELLREAIANDLVRNVLIQLSAL